MSNSDSAKNADKVIMFKTVKVNPKLGGKEAFRLIMDQGKTICDESVFTEAAAKSSIVLTPEAMKYVVDLVIGTAYEKTASDGIARNVGKYIKVMLLLRGTVSTAYSRFDKETCSGKVVVMSRSAAEVDANMDKIAFKNSQVGQVIKITGVSTDGGTAAGEWERGRNGAIGGIGLIFIEGDELTASWTTAAGEEKSTVLSVYQSEVTGLKFEWPSVLDDVAVGTVITLTLHSRNGHTEEEWQTRHGKVTLVEAAEE